MNTLKRMVITFIILSGIGQETFGVRLFVDLPGIANWVGISYQPFYATDLEMRFMTTMFSVGSLIADEARGVLVLAPAHLYHDFKTHRAI